MKKTNLLIITCSIMAAIFWSNDLMADVVYLCSSHENQYVVMVDNEGDCLDIETETMVSSSSIEKSNSIVPVANFLENDKCDGEGKKTEIGFDKNGNGSLDKDEIVGISRSCMPTVAESSEE